MTERAPAASLFADACILLLVLLWSTGCGFAQTAPFSGVCPNGAPARFEKFCPFIVHFRTSPITLDRRVADNMGVNDSEQTRSIALIIAIGKYPLVNGDLSAAEADGDKLTEFLVKDQKFDEVIVLRDGDATAANIDYFLKDYLVNRPVDFPKRARLVIAYSGHGRPADGAEQSAFLLSDIEDLHSASSIYGMDDFSNNVKRLSPLYFQVLTLVNACFGGNFFTATSLSGAGSPDTPTLPGSWAITAGNEQKRVPALRPDRGSVFFDLLIDGVRRGVADPVYWEMFGPFDQNGKPIRRDGITRTGALRTYLASAYARIDQLRSNQVPRDEPLVSPWSGPVQSDAARGGFFFLSDAEVGTARDLVEAYGTNDPTKWASFGETDSTVSTAQTFSLPPGPISSLPSRPYIKIFKQPAVYPVRGYDLSSADGTVDWNVFTAATKPRFVYARAVGWRGPDVSFKERWDHLKEFGIDRGTYVKFDFCRSPTEQSRTLKQVLGPVPSDMLPVAIELVTPTEDQDKAQGVHQLPCYTSRGVDQAKDDILALASELQEYTGKVPLLYGNRYNLSVLTDGRSERYMVWLGAYGQSGNRLAGSNPWTLWQYSGTEKTPGIGDQTTAEVFFGTEAQYQRFREGKANVALEAVLPPVGKH